MIGQESLLQHFDNLIKNGALQHFCLFVGQKGSGKKMLMLEVAKMLKAQCIIEDISVASVREMIENAYKNTAPIVYVIPDADSMSTQAKNALLKVTEEPPNNSYFFMSLEDINNTLPTIKSRATVYKLQNYSNAELRQYFKENYKVSDAYEKIVLSLCETPGEIDNICAMNAEEFYEYVKKVIDNIATVDGANAFKIADSIALKDDVVDKYDLRLFFKAFMTICIDKMDVNAVKYAKGVSITSDYLRELNTAGINKQMLFDSWLLEIRRAWMEV